MFSPNTSKSDMSDLWMADQMHTYVLESKGKILGTYFIKPNHPDLGSHIANAGYMVHPDYHGQGIGKLLCEHSMAEAEKHGFIAMQFNMVVSTNEGAIKLWQKCGFRIIGTIPKAFDHQSLGLVDAHIMYKDLKQ